MEKCTKCGVPAHIKPLHRTNSFGQSDAGWMCQDCIKKTEPELHKNLNEDGSFGVTNSVFNAINKQ